MQTISRTVIKNTLTKKQSIMKYCFTDVYTYLNVISLKQVQE